MKRLTSDQEPLDASKMSFGEHLEELRVALWKAVVALFFGFLIGLLFGNSFVAFVNEPLTAGLKDLVEKQKERRYQQLLPEGVEPNDDALDAGLVPETYYFEPDALAESGLKLESPAADAELAPGGLVPLVLWRSIEDDPSIKPIATGIPDGFSVYIKASLVVGAVASSPFVFYFLWSFVAAGLYPHEKRYIHIFLPFSIGLFLFGATVAFFFAFQFVLSFLFQFYDWMGISPTPRISEWLGFVLILPLGFGVAFQLPLVMLFLERIGVMNVAGYMKYWRYAVLVIFVISMLLTPADPQSLVLMAVPLTLLYFGGVLLCKFMPRPAKSFEEQLDED